MPKIPIKTSKDIKKIKKACQITAQLLDETSTIIQPGITTEDINTFVHKRTLELGGYPAPLNYKGFPKSICTSVNEVVCHGIPSKDVILKEGDIINVDITTIYEGYYGDASRMYLVGGEESCSQDALDLVNAAKEALNIGIQAVKPNAHFGDIGEAIEEYITKLNKGYGIVREYTGHGIGKEFHELPQVLHFAVKGKTPKIKQGMVFTIEPMINQGTYKTVLDKNDGWTVRTKDNKLSAQWEHTILVTDTGAERLTLSPSGFYY